MFGADQDLTAAHDPDFRTSKKDWESFVETLSEKVSEIDATIPELPAKDLVSTDLSATYEANAVF